MSERKIVLSPSAKLISVFDAQGKYVIDRSGNLALGYGVSTPPGQPLSAGLMPFEGSKPWHCRTLSAATSSSKPEAVDLEIERIEIEIGATKRLLAHQAEVGSLVISESGMFVVAVSAGDDLGDIERLWLSLEGKVVVHDGASASMVAAVWKLSAYRGERLVTEVRVEPRSS